MDGRAGHRTHAPHAENAGSEECGSDRCARTVDLQLMHLPQRARRLSFSLSASFFWDAPPVDFGAGVSMPHKKGATRVL